VPESIRKHEVLTEGVEVLFVRALTDGGVLAVGSTTDPGGDHDGWVLRLDEHATPLWEHTFGGDEDIELLSAAEVAGTFVLAGRRIADGWQRARVMVLGEDGALVGEAFDVGEIGDAHIVTTEVATNGDVAILANQRFESLLFERWTELGADPRRIVHEVWPDPWLVGMEMRAGPDADMAVVSPILENDGDGTWIRRIDRDGLLTTDVRLPGVGYGCALAVDAAGVLVGGWTRAPYGSERCVLPSAPGP